MSDFISYKNISIHYSDQGKGMAIVLLHGFLENLNTWNNLTDELKKNHRVITIDLLGHGKTECLGYVHTMEEMAEAIKAVLDYLKLNRYVIIGHSMGGYVALSFAEKYYTNILGLCLTNSTSKADSDERIKNRNRAITAVKQNHKTFIRISISNLFRPKNRRLFSKEIKQIKKDALEMPVQGIIAALEGMKIRADRKNVLRETSFNKMMVIGRKDPVLNYDAVIEEAKNNNIYITELPDGHMSHIENKKDFTYMIMRFIEKL